MALTSARPLATGLVVCAVLSVASPAPLLAWWNDAWGLRVKVTFNNSAQAENLVNFPVLIQLDGSRIEYFRTQDAGQDIRFVDADDATVLAHEIEVWNEAGTSYVWVRIPQVDASSSTDFIWMYYGNVNAADGQNATAVWSASYRGVWHLRENPGGAAPQMRDSTSNGSHGTTFGGMAAAQQVPGRIGGALNFDGVDDYVSGSIPAAPTQYTYEAWINRNTTLNPEHHIVALNNTQFFVEDNDKLEAGTTSEFNVNGPTSIGANTWYHAAFVQTAAGWTIYLNGQVETSGPQATAPGTGFVIGVYFVPATGGHFPGLIDEARISDTPRSAAWIAAQYKSMSGTFATYGARESGPCCQSLTTTMVGSNITVTGPGSFEMTFDKVRGGGLANFYDLAEDPGRAYDLAGKPSVNFHGLFHSSMMSGGLLYTTGTNSTGAKLDLLEATPTRVRVRQEAFFERVLPATGLLAGVKGIGDYSVYPERVALRWNRRTTAAVPQTDHPLEIGVRREIAPDPRDSVNLYTQTDNTFPNPATDDFVLAQHDVAGVRTDVLAILYADWSDADNLTVATTAAYFSWRDSPAVTPVPAGTSEAWNFLIHYKPTDFASNVDPAVTSRSSDFRGPSALTTLVGGPWQSASENTGGGDDFNEAEAAYPLTLDPALGLRFRIDGSVATPRYSPFFKIRQWRSLGGAPSVTLQGTPLAAGVDYRAAVKPVSRAHLARDLAWHSTLQDGAAVTSPDIGGAGSVVGAPAFVAARYGNGASISASTQYVAFPTTGHFDRARGALEFWYQPTYAGTDGVWHDICGFSDLVSNVFVLEKKADNNLYFTILASGTTSQIRVTSANNSWRANDWVHIRLEWDDSLPVLNQMRIVLNGSPMSPDISWANDYNSANLTVQPEFRFGNSDGDGTFAPGLFDEIHLYTGSSTTPTSLAYAGLASDANEYVGDAGKNYVLDLSGVNASGQGRYLYMGADSQFRGLNVGLAIAGAGVAAGDLDWEYSNGTSWVSMESGFSFTDTTNSFTKTGTLSWTDLAGWSPYSVNGGPDLFYVRAHLKAGAAYSTPPQEGLIKTDILLFQYCGDISAPAQEFVFGAPVPTAVRLMSFGAIPGDGAVTLEWRTGSELDNLGFHVYRGPSADGPWTRLTSSLIPGLGSSPLGRRTPGSTRASRTGCGTTTA